MAMHILAANVDVSQIIGLIVLVVSVLSWFVNVIQGNTPDGTPRQNKANGKAKIKPKPPTGRSELEALAQQLAGEKNRPRPEQASQLQPQRPPKPPVDRNRPKTNPTQQRPIPQRTVPQRPGQPAARPAPRVSETHLASSNLGASVRGHHLANRVEEAVEREIAAPVRQDLGTRTSLIQAVPEQFVHPLVKMLREPNGMRQAVLLNEILQRPKSTRN